MSDVPDKKPDDADEPGDGTWSEDQKKREYYYDDAHGYEKYDPGADEEEELERQTRQKTLN